MSAAIETEIRRKVRRWLDYADEDLRLARHALTLATGVPYRLVAWHAQQGAEKSLKAFSRLSSYRLPLYPQYFSFAGAVSQRRAMERHPA